MGVVCQILLNKTQEDFFKPGSHVTGIVKYSIDKPTEYKSVTLSLIGTGHCEWEERDSKNDSKKTFEGNEQYVNIVHSLLQTKCEKAILDEGVYEYPFDFLLPEDIPSTHFDHTSTISYRIELKFATPKLFSFNKVFKTEITVRGYVEAPTGLIDGPILFGLEKKLTKLFSSKKPVINIKAEVEKVLFKPDDDINTSLTVANDTNITVNVRMSLYCHKVYTADCGSTDISMDKVRDWSLGVVSVPPKGVANLTQPIPTRYDNLLSINTKVLRKEYRLRVSLKLPMPYKNERSEISLVIGDLRTDEDFEAKDLLPSYWEVMGEKDEKMKN